MEENGSFVYNISLDTRKLIFFTVYAIFVISYVFFYLVLSTVPFRGGSDVVLCCLFWCQSFGVVSPYICSLYFEFGLGC